MNNLIFQALVPAAGIGERFGGLFPKQYIQIKGRMVIDHTICTLLANSKIAKVHIAVAKGDKLASQIGQSLNDDTQAKIEVHRCGKQTRAATVYALAKAVKHEDCFFLVHDAVRPCLHPSDLTKVLDLAKSSQSAAMLAVPVADTLKKVVEGRVEQTISRENLWQAQTPQVVPAAMLIKALTNNLDATDEAQAIEKIGQEVLVAQADYPNPKLTNNSDLELITKIIANL